LARFYGSEQSSVNSSRRIRGETRHEWDRWSSGRFLASRKPSRSAQEEGRQKVFASGSEDFRVDDGTAQIVEPVRSGRSPGLEGEMFAEDPGRASATVVSLNLCCQSKSVKLVIKSSIIIHIRSKSIKNEDLGAK
jgi:hypothetical protein